MFIGLIKSTVAPTANEDASSGYNVGVWWEDTVTGNVYQCKSNEKAAAVWIVRQGVAYKHGGATHYTEFEADGTLKMNGDAKVWDDLRVQILTRVGGTAPAFTSGFAGNATLYSYHFAHNALNNVYFEVQMPHGWDGGVIYPHVHWSPTTTGTGVVVWNFEYTMIELGGTFDATAATHDTIPMKDTVASADQWGHRLIGGTITPSASQNGISTMLICRLYRDGGVGDDNYGAAASLLAFDIHYQMDTIGSRDPISK